MKPSPKLIATLRLLLLGTVGLATLLAVFVAVENWRGDRAWAAVERELQAKGERLEFSAFLPKPVPDEQNFFKAPLLARVLYNPPSAEKTKLLANIQLGDFYFNGHSGGTPTDLTVFRDHLKRIGRLAKDNTEPPAAGILTAFRPLQPLLDELRQAARNRPAAVHDYGAQPYERPWLDLAVAFDLGQALALRASAELALGHTDEAFDDVYAALRLANSLSAHPTGLELLAAEATMGAATRPIAEGRQHHAWSETQLATFQRELSELHPLAAFRDTMRAQRAISLQIIDAMPAMPPSRLPIKPTWPLWMFHGWAQQNKVALCHHYDEDVLSVFTVEPERIFPDRVERAQQDVGLLVKSHSPYEWVAQRSLQNIVGLLEGFARSAESNTQAAVACALERYHLVQHRYPDKLDELVPAFLSTVPTGIFDGIPLRYVRLPQDSSQIYSSGPDGHDDGGLKDDIVLKLPDAS